jgi:capsular polysaccharide transport system permease protein
VLEENSGVLTIATQGFKSKDAKKINDAILERSEWFLNEISHKIAKDEALFFENQIKQAAKRVNEAKKAIISFQVENNIINPSTQLKFGTKLIANLIGELASHETELRTLSSYLSNNSPQIISTQSKIAALKGQIDKESRVIAGGDEQALNSISLKFQDLETEAKIAEQIYEATVASLEKNRLDSAKKFKSLAIISAAILPEKPILPKRLYNIMLFAIIIGAAYGSIRLILSSIKEHI